MRAKYFISLHCVVLHELLVEDILLDFVEDKQAKNCAHKVYAHTHTHTITTLYKKKTSYLQKDFCNC